jgi:hypothetical protein
MVLVDLDSQDFPDYQEHRGVLVVPVLHLVHLVLVVPEGLVVHLVLMGHLVPMGLEVPAVPEHPMVLVVLTGLADLVDRDRLEVVITQLPVLLLSIVLQMNLLR